MYLTDSSFSFQKLYAVCDIALGLLVSKATNITLKDSNVEPVLPAKCFVKQAKVDKSHIHVHCMLGAYFIDYFNTIINNVDDCYCI